MRFSVLYFGASNRNRTCNLLITNCGSLFLCGLVVCNNMRKIVILLLHCAVSCNDFLWP